MTRRNLPSALRDLVRFHGHSCPGLLIGYRAGKIAMDRLGAKRSADEELVAVVENDSCAVDAIQCLTGCTLGKGNLFLRDYGKQVFTVARRPSGRGVRVALRPDAFDRRDRKSASRALSVKGDEELFRIERVTVDLPKEAEIRESVLCEACGEAVMDTRTRKVRGRRVCIPCAEKKRRKG